MKRFLAALPASFYSRELYRSVASDWKGAGLVYQLLLIAIATLAVTIRLHVGAVHFVEKEAPPLLAQVPAIDIDHGVVSVNHPMPVTITDPDSGKVLAIIDTSGEITSLDGTDAVVLLTRDKLIGRKRAGTTETYDLKRIEHLHLDRKVLDGWLRTIASWFAVFCAPFILAGLYAGRLLVMAIVATIVFLASRFTLQFADATRLVSVALTPATLIEALLDGIGIKPGIWGFFWLVLVAGYVTFARRASRIQPPLVEATEVPAPEPPPPSGPY